MDKMRMESVDITDQNIEKIGALFPNVITEAKDENGKLTKAINFELLKQELSKEVIDGDEVYEFTWVGKKAAIVEANKPIRKTLRPCKEESVNWDTTENLYIEGDNLEVLKLLQESYLGKVKMIYIDPPYNTGNDFIYDDDFTQSQDEYNEDSGSVDENGDRMFKNTDANGRFHSAWCSMMYERLLMARSLLSDDGIIMISIDENEFKTLGCICDQIFGERNFVECLVYDKKAAAKGVPPVNMIVGVPEQCDSSTDAFKAGYQNICEIGKERIRRAAKKIHEEHPDAKFDDGFRVLKVDESNMTDVYYSADSYDQNMLNQLESNIKPDRTDLDLLFGCLLEWGLPLSMPYVSEDIEGCTIHTYNDGDLIACFNNDIPESVIKEIAKRQPLRAVFRDSGFKGSPEKINVGETFKLLSPDTRVKII